MESHLAISISGSNVMFYLLKQETDVAHFNDDYDSSANTKNTIVFKDLFPS